MLRTVKDNRNNARRRSRSQVFLSPNRLGLSLFVSCLSVAISIWPAQAAKLKSWRFDVSNSHLEFTTNETITPRVQLIPNPVRLVVDLPGVQNQPPTVQSYGKGVRSLRVGQFDRVTARIVLELEPGYSVDPEQVKVENLSALAWRIKLPTPQFTGEEPSTNPNPAPTPIAAPLPQSSPQSPPPKPAPPTPTVAVTSNNVLDDVLVTSDGLFLKTQRAVEDVQLQRSNDGREINIELPGVTAAQAITRNSYRMEFHGIQRIAVNQISNTPPRARITLRVDRRSPDWSATANRIAGVVLIPQSRSATTRNEKQPSSTISLADGSGNNAGNLPTFSPPSNRPEFTRPGFNRPGAFSAEQATVQAVNLGGSQLLIRTDRSLFYTTGWEGSNYRITLLNAQLAPRLREPAVGLGSPLSQIQFQPDGRNIKILFAPAQGVRFAGVTRLDGQTLVANLLRPGQTATIPTPGFPTTNPFPPVIGSGTPSPIVPPSFPRPNGRKVVVIDPGHGGPDPGAIGIGGLREVDIVLEVSLQVSRLLQRQGVVVYLTRTSNAEDVDLAPRVALAERVRATAFVSIHANAINMSRPDINGLESFYAPGAVAGRELAETIYNAVQRSADVRGRSLRSARFYVIRRTSMPSALIETGFVTGAIDAPKLATSEHRSRLANGIAQGILEFLNRR